VSQLEPPPAVQSDECPHAGDLLHLDIKPLARIVGVGHPIHGDLSKKRRGVGYEYAHVAIDDATRLAYVEVQRSGRRRACAAFLRHALVWFRRLGVTVGRVLTDNGAGCNATAWTIQSPSPIEALYEPPRIARGEAHPGTCGFLSFCFLARSFFEPLRWSPSNR
jgi:hypothetical protein